MMFRHMMVTLLLSASAGVAMAAEHEASDIAGVWETASGGYVQLYEDGGQWKGDIVGSADGKHRTDENNPDESKHERPLLGVTLLNGLDYVGDGKYENGTIYDPNNGKTYKAKATQTGPDTLEARGYIGISLIGRSETWNRIDPKAENVNQDTLHQPVGAAPQ